MDPAEHAQLVRQSMRTPPLFENPPSSTHYLDAPVPSRQSMLFTQPVTNPDYRNSSIVYEKPRSNRNSGLLTSTELKERKKTNRATVFLDNPATRNPSQETANVLSPMQTRTRGKSRPISLDSATVRQKSRNRHTVMNPTGIGLTITPQTPVPEEDEDVEVSSSSTLMDSPSRPAIKSQVSDPYCLPSPSESTIVSQPLVRPQLRPNARDIRSRRHSRASRTLSKAASTPLSNSYGVGIASMTYGGNTNAGLKDMSFGQYGMNQNFGIVSHRASQYLAQEAAEEDQARRAGKQPNKQKPAERKPYERKIVTRSSKRRLRDILFGWAKGFKSDSRERLKGRIQHTTI